MELYERLFPRFRPKRELRPQGSGNGWGKQRRIAGQKSRDVGAFNHFISDRKRKGIRVRDIARDERIADVQNDNANSVAADHLPLSLPNHRRAPRQSCCRH